MGQIIEEPIPIQLTERCLEHEISQFLVVGLMFGLVLIEQRVVVHGKHAFLGQKVPFCIEDKFIQEGMKTLPSLMATIFPAGFGLLAKREEALMLFIQNRVTDAVFSFPVSSHFWFYRRDSG